MGFTEKSDFYGGDLMKNQYRWGNCLKREGLDSLQIYGGAWQERGGGVCEGG